MTRYSLNIPDDLLKQLKDAHAETYPEHRQSFNAWMVKILGHRYIWKNPGEEWISSEQRC